MKSTNKNLIAFAMAAIVITACKKSDTAFNNQTTSPNQTTSTVSAEEGSVSSRAWTGSGNQIPRSKAGADQTITLPVNSVSFDGSGSYDGDGSIASYQWTKETGNGGTITSATSAKTTVTALAKGEYRFKLVVTDNKGATGSDTVHVSVQGTGGITPPPVPSGNQAPVVNVSSNQTITLPASSCTLSGSATDADGSITSYQWTKVSGTGGTITSPNSTSTSVTGLSAGSYAFNLKATDNGGASANKNVTVTVNPSATTPPPPPPTPTGSYGTLVYSTGYDKTGDLDPYGNGQLGNGSLSTSIYKIGPGSFKSVPANVSAGIRSEVQYPDNLTPTEGAIEYDVMYEVIPQNSCHSLQFHPNTSGGSASPGLWHENGKFTWVNWKGGTNTKYPTNFAIPKNQWMHVVFEYKIGSAGYMKFTIDGTVVLNATNIQVGDGSGQYLKVGVNMWVNQSSTVYYDNLKIWKK